MMILQEIRIQISKNLEAGLPAYTGLRDAEIAFYNQSIMFGENDEAFPENGEWSAWTN